MESLFYYSRYYNTGTACNPQRAWRRLGRTYTIHVYTERSVAVEKDMRTFLVDPRSMKTIKTELFRIFRLFYFAITYSGQISHRSDRLVSIDDSCLNTRVVSNRWRLIVYSSTPGLCIVYCVVRKLRDKPTYDQFERPVCDVSDLLVLPWCTCITVIMCAPNQVWQYFITSRRDVDCDIL